MANPNEICIGPGDLNKEFTCEAGRKYVFRLSRSRVFWLEISDAFFHPGSAVMMPDDQSASNGQTPASDQASGLSVVLAAYAHAADHPDQKALLAGHVDAGASAGGCNGKDLSKFRAAGIGHLLLGEKDAWVGIAQQHHQNDDLKRLLRWVARWKGWPCHTDATGDDLDAGATEATRAFQSEFSKPENGYSISIDGTVGKQTWGAFFEMYMQQLAQLAGTDAAGLDALRARLAWLNENHKSIGCGNSHPIDMPGRDDFQSQTNDRVEMLFFGPSEEPLKGPAGDACHTAGSCGIYNFMRYRYERIVPASKPVETMQDWIEIAVVDRDGQPLAGRRYQLTLPDGSISEGEVPENGLISVKNIASGSCSIFFPVEEKKNPGSGGGDGGHGDGGDGGGGDGSGGDGTFGKWPGGDDANTGTGGGGVGEGTGGEGGGDITDGYTGGDDTNGGDTGGEGTGSNDGGGTFGKWSG